MTATRTRLLLGLLVCLADAAANRAAAADLNDHTINLGGGKLRLTVPDTWTRKEPRVRIIEYEFAVPASAGDATGGRVTVMGAGGSVEDNIDRWIGQFTQPGGESTKERAKVKKTKIGGEEVHFVDVSGTFKDQQGPMAAAVEHKQYRLLGAIIKSSQAGNYFVKFTGPRQTVTDNEKAFLAMIESLERR